MNTLKKIWNIFIALSLTFLIIFLFYLNNSEKFSIKHVTYKEFLNMAKENKVEKVDINFNKDSFNFQDKEKKMYETANPKYENFKKDLLERNIEVNVKKDFNMLSILSILINCCLIYVMIYTVSNVMKTQQGDMNSKLIKPEKDEKEELINQDGKQKTNKRRTSFKDVAGLKPIKEDMMLLVDFLKNPKSYTEAGAKLPKGVILYGPPGTGKTLLAKAIAGEAEVPFYSVSGSDFIEMFVGMGARRVRELFKEARKKAPCIVFIDELDAIGNSRSNLSNGNTEHRQTINALLSEMDGFNGTEGILVIGATNRLEDLDNALIRPGRFDKYISVPLPETPEERLEVINIYKDNKKFAEDVDFGELSKETIGFSPADIEALLNESALISVQKKKRFIDRNCIDDAIYKKLLKGHAKEDTN